MQLWLRQTKLPYASGWIWKYTLLCVCLPGFWLFSTVILFCVASNQLTVFFCFKVVMKTCSFSLWFCVILWRQLGLLCCIHMFTCLSLFSCHFTLTHLCLMWTIVDWTLVRVRAFSQSRGKDIFYYAPYGEHDAEIDGSIIRFIDIRTDNHETFIQSMVSCPWIVRTPLLLLIIGRLRLDSSRNTQKHKLDNTWLRCVTTWYV